MLSVAELRSGCPCRSVAKTVVMVLPPSASPSSCVSSDVS